MRRKVILLPCSHREAGNTPPLPQDAAGAGHLEPLRQDDHLAAQCPHPLTEEMLIPDARAGLTPSQQVERKLLALLQRGALPRKPQGR